MDGCCCLGVTILLLSVRWTCQASVAWSCLADRWFLQRGVDCVLGAWQGHANHSTYPFPTHHTHLFSPVCRWHWWHSTFTQAFCRALPCWSPPPTRLALLILHYVKSHEQVYVLISVVWDPRLQGLIIKFVKVMGGTDRRPLVAPRS